MSPIVAVLFASVGVWIPLLAGLLVAHFGAAGRGQLARRSLLASLLAGAALLLMLGPESWVIEGSVSGRALVELRPVDRWVGAGVLVCGLVALWLDGSSAESARAEAHGRFVVLVASCAALSLCADLIAVVTVSFAIAVAELWYRRAHDPSAASQPLGPLLLGLGTALTYGGLSTTSFGELSGRVSAVFTKWGGAMQFLGPLERDLPLPEGARAQFVGDVVTGAAPAMLTVVGMAVLVAGLLVAGRYLVAPGSAEPAGRAINGLCRLAIVSPFVAIFVRGFGALRLVFAPYGWPVMVVLVLGLGVIAVLTNRARPRPTLLDVAGTLMSGCVLLLLTQVAVARPLLDGDVSRLNAIVGFAVVGAIGICLAGIVLVRQPKGLAWPLALALLGFAPPSAGAAALLAAGSLNAAVMPTACALASLIGCWWLVPSIRRANPGAQTIPWPVVFLMALLFLMPLAPPVAAALGR